MLRIHTACPPKCFAFRYRTAHLFAEKDYQSFSLRKNPLRVRLPSLFRQKEKTPFRVFSFWWRRRVTAQCRVTHYMDSLALLGVTTVMARKDFRILCFEGYFPCFSAVEPSLHLRFSRLVFSLIYLPFFFYDAP